MTKNESTAVAIAVGSVVVLGGPKLVDHLATEGFTLTSTSQEPPPQWATVVGTIVQVLGVVVAVIIMR